jgi:MFS family permease
MNFKFIRNPLFVAILGIAIAGITFGLIGPALVILLEKSGRPGYITGLVTTTGLFAITFFSHLCGKAIDRYGIKKILSCGLLVTAATSIAMIFWRNLWILFPVRFIMGVSVTMIFVATEVLINIASPEEKRGRNIGIYAIALSAGIAAGALLIWTVEIAEWVPFITGAGIILFVYILEELLLTEFPGYNDGTPVEPLALKKIPSLALAAAAFYGFFEASITVVIPLYAIRGGYTDHDVSYLLASYVIGGVVLLYIFSYLSDKISKTGLMVYMASGLALLLFSMPYSGNFLFMILILFMIGGIVPAFYTVGLAYTADKVEKQFIAQANAYFITAYGAGTLIGPVSGTLLLDFNLQYAYWYFGACLSVVFILFCFLRDRA